MAKAGTIAPLAKQALAAGVSVDELVKQHPELDEKALRRGYAQVKSKAKGGAPKASKKTGKKKARKKGSQASKVAEVTTQAPVRVFRADGTTELVPNSAPNPDHAELRKFILQHGTKAVRSVLADLES